MQRGNSLPGPVRRRILFRGWVQGVGFRYRARHAAEMFGCSGWCRNEGDGSVLMEIQGAQASIDQVLQAIQRGSFIRIEAMDLWPLPLVEGESGFRTE